LGAPPHKTPWVPPTHRPRAFPGGPGGGESRDAYLFGPQSSNFEAEKTEKKKPTGPNGGGSWGGGGTVAFPDPVPPALQDIPPRTSPHPFFFSDGPGGGDRGKPWLLFYAACFGRHLGAHTPGPSSKGKGVNRRDLPHPGGGGPPHPPPTGGGGGTPPCTVASGGTLPRPAPERGFPFGPPQLWGFIGLPTESPQGGPTRPIPEGVPPIFPRKGGLFFRAPWRP